MGAYTLRGELGRGGQGVVYRATHDSTHRLLAFKILAPDSANDKVKVEEFHRQAVALARLDHPSVVTVFDSGCVVGVPYLAMELVEGPPLADFLLRRALTLAGGIGILSKIADAVHHANLRGVILRQLTSTSVLVNPEGVPILMDFDLATAGADGNRIKTDESATGFPNADPRPDLCWLGYLLEEVISSAADARSVEESMATTLELTGGACITHFKTAGSLALHLSEWLHRDKRDASGDLPRACSGVARRHRPRGRFRRFRIGGG